MSGPKKHLLECTMEIAEAIRMFKPQSLKDAISLAHMKDDQIQRMRKSYP